MSRARRWVVALVLLLSVAASGCKLDDLTAGVTNGGDTDPTAGTLTVSLTTPNADDGAIRFTLTGPFVTTPHAASTGHLVFTRQRSPQELDVVVVGDLGSEAILILPVGNTDVAADYQVTITQVATRTNALRADLTGYGTRVLRSAR